VTGTQNFRSSTTRYFRIPTCPSMRGGCTKSIATISTAHSMERSTGTALNLFMWDARVSHALRRPPTFTCLWLQTLSRLDLSCNKIQGQLPGRAIQRLFQLTQLELSRNLLRGPIPTQLSSLTKLQDLSLARNQLTGSIPTGLSTLTALKTLDLSSNHLEGTIPEQLSELGDLLVLDLSWNRISGPLLHGLWRFQHLVKLSVHHNILTGPLPETVGRLKCAEYLHLQCNHLDGVLPLDALQRLNPGVRELLLHENRFFFRGNCEASEGDSQNMNRGGRSRKGARRQRHRPAQSGPRSRQGGSSSNTAEEARLELLEVFPDLTIVI